MTMCAQTAHTEERLQAQQEDFHGSYFSPNGDEVPLLSGDEQVLSEVTGALATLSAGPIARHVDDDQLTDAVVAEGVLIVVARYGEYRFPMIVRGERLPDGSATMRYYDHAGTLLLERAGDSDTLNVRIQYTDKPLGAALESARFLEVVATTPGVLSLEMSAPVEGRGIVSERMEVADLPLAVPQSWLENHRNRVRLLEGLFDIWMNTGVEIRYPTNTEDDEGLRNYNFVQRALRGGWVTLSVASFDVHVPDAQARALLEELQAEGQISRTFYLEVPTESYLVFGKEVDLGPSRRYLAAARLKTTQEGIRAQLGDKGEGVGTVDLTWEPIGSLPMHVFFDQWPKSSVRSVDREIQEFEAAYGLSSEYFRQAWVEREPSVRSLPDGKRWLSLIQAREELRRDS
jgi:hypothetical protein